MSDLDVIREIEGENGVWLNEKKQHLIKKLYDLSRQKSSEKRKSRKK